MNVHIPPLEQAHRLQVARPRATRAAINDAILNDGALTPEKLRQILALEDPEKQRLSLMRDALVHPDLQSLVDAGNISFGMVKPHREEAIFVQGTDEEVTDQVIEAIRPPLEVLMQQAIWIPTEVSRAFYAHLPDLILDRVSGFMSGGASTGLVLHQDGEAIHEWRRQMGSTSAHDKPSESHTLRHRFQTARGIENNVTHGSDSIENVKKELISFREMLGVLVG